MGVVWTLLGLGLGLAIFMNLRKLAYKNSDDGFSQAGVSVNYGKKTISIKRKTYSVDAVSGISFRQPLDDGTTLVAIKVQDMKKPVHEIMFNESGSAQTFVERLSLALSKAGKELEDI